MEGVLGLAVLVADIWAILKVVQSRAKTGEKVGWTVLILVLPLIGLVIWWFAGPKK